MLYPSYPLIVDYSIELGGIRTTLQVERVHAELIIALN